MASKFKSSASIISVDDAVGTVLAHDITEIAPGVFKGAAFKKGYIIKQEDIKHLKRLGKEHLFVLSIAPGELHEDEAAVRLAKALAGDNISFTENPSEGKITLFADADGLLKIDVDSLTELNMVPDIACTSRQSNTLVIKGDIVAATRAIPLIISESLIIEVEKIAAKTNGIFRIKKLSHPEVGLIITGSEVFTGRIDDKFAPLIQKKMDSFDCRLHKPVFCPDDKEKIKNAIQSMIDSGIGLLLVAGGMSVDPDDVSRAAIAEAGAKDVIYGTPVQPGAMFLYGRFGEIPVLGLPACVLFYKITVLDLILPRVLAGEKITRKDFAGLSHGGLCLNCEKCNYPVCPFGK